MTVTVNGCTSSAGSTSVVVNPLPPTPTITPGGPTSFCSGSSVTLTSSSAAGNQWYRDNTLINGATGQQYVATISGDYTVRVTDGNGCTSTSAATTVTATPLTVNPATIPAGGFGNPYGPISFSASGSTGTVSFIETGTLPAGMAFSGGTLSGTPTQSGSFPITVSATDSNGCTGSRDYTLFIVAVPSNVIATATSGTQVSVTWTPVTGAITYEVTRDGSSLGTSPTANFTDSTATPATTYFYRVRALTPSSPTLYSSADMATTVPLTDDPIVAGVTVIKAVHLTELRTAINSVRAAASMSAATFTDASLTGLIIQSVHVQELRSALDPARAALGLPAISYTNSLAIGSKVKAADIQEIRNGVK